MPIRSFALLMSVVCLAAALLVLTHAMNTNNLLMARIGLVVVIAESALTYLAFARVLDHIRFLERALYGKEV